MSFLRQLPVIVREIEEEPLELPIRFSKSRPLHQGYYVCHPGCGRLFTDVQSKNQHQYACRRGQINAVQS